MKYSNIDEAIKQAANFIDLANKVIESKRTRDSDHVFSASKDNSAIKRASMDLSRSLSTLRQDR